MVKCNCVCKCFGFFKYEDWPVIYPKNLNIIILYRDNIKVFFKNKAEANKANYHDYDKINTQKYVYAFTGLRGDAKDLWFNIRSGVEKRCKLIKAPTKTDQ